MNYALYPNHGHKVKQGRQMPEFLATNSFRVFLALLTLVLLVVYVIRLSTVSVKGYDISALQKEVKTLKDEDARLQFEIAKNGSMQNIQNRLKSIEFVPVDKPEFASVQPPIIAQR